MLYGKVMVCLLVQDSGNWKLDLILTEIQTIRATH